MQNLFKLPALSFSLVLFGILTVSACKQTVMCDMSFAMITVTIQGDSTASAVVIDNKLKDTFPSESVINQGDFVVVSDSYFNKLKKSESRSFTFIATSVTGKKAQADFIISRTDCHVFKKSGPEIIQY